MIVDFHACWPHAHLNAEDDSIARYFDTLNDTPIQPLMTHLRQCQQPTRDCSTSADSEQQEQLLHSGTLGTDAQRAQPHLPEDHVKVSSHANVGESGHTLLQATDERAALCHESATCSNTCSDPHLIGADAVPRGQSQPRHATERRLPIISFSHFLPLQVELPCRND